MPSGSPSGADPVDLRSSWGGHDHQLPLTSASARAGRSVNARRSAEMASLRQRRRSMASVRYRCSSQTSERWSAGSIGRAQRSSNGEVLGDPGQPVADRRDRAEQVVAVWLLPVHGGVDAALEGVEKKVVGRLGERRARQRRNDVGDVEARPREGLGTEHGVRPPEPPLDPVGGVQYRRGQRQVAALPRRFVLASLDELEQEPPSAGPCEQLVDCDHRVTSPGSTIHMTTSLEPKSTRATEEPQGSTSRTPRAPQQRPAQRSAAHGRAACAPRRRP